jgi:hypothetical protein
MNIYVYMYIYNVCIHVHMYICVYIVYFTDDYVSVYYMYIYTYLNTFIHVCLDIYHVYICKWCMMYTCMYTFICLRIYCISNQEIDIELHPMYCISDVSCLRLSCCINAFIFCVHYLCLIGWVDVFYVEHVDKSSSYETLFHCNILSKHHHYHHQSGDWGSCKKETRFSWCREERIYGRMSYMFMYIFMFILIYIIWVWMRYRVVWYMYMYILE